MEDQSDLIEMTAGIVSAYVGNNVVVTADLPALIQQVHAALANVGAPAAEPAPAPKEPAVAVNKSITKIGEKVPGIGGKTVTVPGNADSKYEVMSSNFTMAGGFLEAPNFIAKAAQKRGIDIKGYTKMGLVDESLDAKWELIDSQKMLPPVNAAVAGKQINNVLAKGDNDPLILPIDVGCKWSSPCTNYGKVPEYLASVAAGRVAKAAGDVAKSKAQEAVQKAVGDKAPDVIKNGLKGLFGN